MCVKPEIVTFNLTPVFISCGVVEGKKWQMVSFNSVLLSGRCSVASSCDNLCFKFQVLPIEVK